MLPFTSDEILLFHFVDNSVDEGSFVVGEGRMVGIFIRSFTFKS